MRQQRAGRKRPLEPERPRERERARPGERGRPRQQSRQAREGDDSSSSSSEGGEDWRQEVWKRGYQGPFGPWVAWPTMSATTMWPQANTMAAGQQYPGGRMGNNVGRYQAEAQQGGFRGRQRDNDGGWNSRKRQRYGYEQQQRNRWEEDERYYEEEEEWEDSRRLWEHGERPPPKRQLPRPKPKPKAFQQIQDEDDDEDADLIQPMLAMKIEIAEVPKKFIAKIIGKKGATIKMIRDETGAHVDARDQTQDPCQVKLLGSPEAIEAARKKITEIIQQATQKPGIVIEIPRAKIGKVIGIRGAQIHEIQETTGAKVDVDKDTDPCKVTIGGNDVQIAMAEKVVLTLAMEAADMESEYLELPSQVSGAVLGVKGARLMELQAASGARIDVDKTRPDACRVRIAGTPDQIELAKQLVLLATETPKPTEADLLAAEGMEPQPMDAGGVAMDLPPGTAGKIIGKNGVTIQNVQSETGARVWVDCEAGQARISGDPDAVERAKMLIEALAHEALTEDGETGGQDPAGNLAQSVPSVMAAAPAQGGWKNWGRWSESAEASAGADDWVADQGDFAQGDTWVGNWEQAPTEEQTEEKQIWEWNGQAPEPEQTETQEDLPPMVRPKTAMQRAFAMLAAKRGY